MRPEPDEFSVKWIHLQSSRWTTSADLGNALLQTINGRVDVSHRCWRDTWVRFFSPPRSEGWPLLGRTFNIYPCPVSFWLTLPRRVLSTSWCCLSRQFVAFLAFVHLTLFLALSLSPGNSLVSSWCDHSMLASLLWRCPTVPSLLQLC